MYYLVIEDQSGRWPSFETSSLVGQRMEPFEFGRQSQKEAEEVKDSHTWQPCLHQLLLIALLLLLLFNLHNYSRLPHLLIIQDTITLTTICYHFTHLIILWILLLLFTPPPTRLLLLQLLIHILFLMFSHPTVTPLLMKNQRLSTPLPLLLLPLNNNICTPLPLNTLFLLKAIYHMMY